MEAKKRWGRNAGINNCVKGEKRVGYFYCGCLMVMGYGPTWEAALEMADREHPTQGRA